MFDGVYCPLLLDQKSEIHGASNYNQIYFDFGVIELHDAASLYPSARKIDIDSMERLEINFTNKIDREVVIVSALGLENKETAEDGEKLF